MKPTVGEIVNPRWADVRSGRNERKRQVLAQTGARTWKAAKKAHKRSKRDMRNQQQEAM